MTNAPAGTVFHEGEEVVVAEGTYQGTLGVFLRLRRDIKWADITARDGAIRSHPVEWLAPSRGAAWKLTGQESLLPAAPQPLALRTAGAVC